MLWSTLTLHLWKIKIWNFEYFYFNINIHKLFTLLVFCHLLIPQYLCLLLTLFILLLVTLMVLNTGRLFVTRSVLRDHFIMASYHCFIHCSVVRVNHFRFIIVNCFQFQVFLNLFPLPIYHHLNLTNLIIFNLTSLNLTSIQVIPR
jgi:hypothetical protein